MGIIIFYIFGYIYRTRPTYASITPPSTPADLGLNYLAILDTAIDIAMGMCYLHDRQIIHSDLKVGSRDCGALIRLGELVR